MSPKQSLNTPSLNGFSRIRAWWSSLFRHQPNELREVIELLQAAQAQGIIRSESRQMLEGVLKIADLTARDVMISAARMDMINIEEPLEDILNRVIDIAHSRYPVYESERDHIIGILLSKDLLKRQRSPNLNLRALLRPVVMVPQSKGLLDLLKDFRLNRNHLAVVIDEFGRVAGLVTIEDVLEEIVGEIEDEFDTDEEAGDIFGLGDQTYRIAGDTAIPRVMQAFGLQSPEAHEHENFETIGGWVAHEMGHVPSKGESHVLMGLRFEVMHTRAGAVKWFKVKPLPPTPSSSPLGQKDPVA
jgi:magnesium and cobalt transporter